MSKMIIEHKQNRSDVTYNDTIFANVYIRSNLCCIDDRILFNENMITNMDWKKGDTERKRIVHSCKTTVTQLYHNIVK